MDLVHDINIETTAPLDAGHVQTQNSKQHHKPDADCQNCGAKLVGEYCHACGQLGHIHRSVLHVIEEVLHGITHLDSRTWRSLPMLAFRPGTLTRNYVMGQRARYVPPFAMFLFSIFAMFLVFAFSGGPNLVSEEVVSKSERVQTARDQFAEAEINLNDAKTELTDVEKELAALQAETETGPGEIGAATGQLASSRGQLVVAQRQYDTAKTELATELAKPEVKVSTQGSVAGSPSKATFTFDTDGDRQKALAEMAKEKEKAIKSDNEVEARILGAAEVAVKAAPVSTSPSTQTEDSPQGIMTMLKDSMRRGDFINTPWPELNKKIAKKTKNPDLFLYKLQNTAYKFSFLLVPLSLPFIWIMLFWKKDVTLFDHAVFALYSLSFVSFLFMAVSLAAHWMPLGRVVGIAALILPVHIFFQLKGAYQLKWFSAFWRTAFFCCVSSWVVLIGFLISIVALGVTG